MQRTVRDGTFPRRKHACRCAAAGRVRRADAIRLHRLERRHRHVAHHDDAPGTHGTRRAAWKLSALKVVANPLLNPETSPVAAAFFESLANLDAELVRYGLRGGPAAVDLLIDYCF